MKEISSSILIILCSLTVTFSCLQAQEPTKVHILFVWGTKATDTRTATMVSKKKIEAAFEGPIGLSKGSPNNIFYGPLQGENAHPKTILDTCEKMSRAASSNDAVFVYILCHGASVIEDNDPSGTRIHALSPVCTDAKNVDMRTIGIRRSSIMRVMKSQPHRLNLLITDSCATFNGNPPKERHVRVPFQHYPTEIRSYLARILYEAKGSYSINSSHPLKGSMNQGELAMAWVPNAGGRQGEAYLDYAAEQNHSGTVFTNAFLNVSKRKTYDTPVSCDKFVKELKQELDTTFQSTKKMVKDTGAFGVESFMMQTTQTLTLFDDRGVPLP